MKKAKHVPEDYSDIILISALLACGRVKQAPARVPQASDSLYTARAANGVMLQI